MKQPQQIINKSRETKYKVKQLFGSFRTCDVIETKVCQLVIQMHGRYKLYVEDEKKIYFKTKTIGHDELPRQQTINKINKKCEIARRISSAQCIYTKYSIIIFIFKHIEI